jgi:TPR repeat protein
MTIGRSMSRSARTLAACLLAAGMTLPALAGQALDEANRAYYDGDYLLSLSMYERLAREGDAAAAERAGFMLLDSGQAHAGRVRPDPERARALLVQAARAGRPGAAFLLNMTELTE